MKTGKGWSSWKSSSAALLVVLPLLFCAPGCITDRANVERNLMSLQSVQRNEGVTEQYRVACPDVIELLIPQRPEFNGRYEIGIDGRINLGDYGNPRIEGRTPAEVAKVLAAETGVGAEGIQLRIVEFRSQHVLLFGEVNGRQRRVPYRGQETVLDLLQRVGGITPGAEPTDVYVVRPHVSDNRRPEVFHVDLQAIVMKHDDKTNLRVLPNDQVYVGETQRAKLQKAIPPWLRWTYQWVWDTKPAAPPRDAAAEPAPSAWIDGTR